MKYSLYKKIRFLNFNVLILIIFSACSQNKISNLEDDISIDEREEILLQKTILIKEMAKASIKLQKITWPILKKNKAQCLKTKSYSYGVLYAYIKDLPSEDIQIFHDLYNSSIKKIYFDKYKTNNFPIILSVAENSPGFEAGLKSNDIVVKINGDITQDFRKKLNLLYETEDEITISVLRKKQIKTFKLNGVKACAYNVQPFPSGAPNAFADGNKVFITMAAIKLAQTDDEIAFLIGHEIAHNIKHFKKFNSNEANTLAINYLDMPKVREFGDLFIWTNEQKEIEADIEGVKLAFKAGYSLKNVNDYWRRLSVFNPELIKKSQHIYKGNAFRAALINKTLNELKLNKDEQR
ncbi:M48 family metallopeptidase [Alphaproteobacteria bacterium]|nr:M48 family metallopeptidase [Alphaproteobacteria bacterium]